MRFTLVLIVLVTTFAQVQGSSPKDKQFVYKVLAVVRQYMEAKDFDDAAATLTSAVAAQAQASVNPADSAPLLSKLAEVYGFTKDWSDQEKAFEKLAAIWTNKAGPDSAVAVHYLLAQEMAYERAGDFASADAMEQKAIPVLNQLYGPNSWAVRSALEKSSHLQSKLGNDEKSKELASEAAPRMRGIDPGHNVTAPRLMSKVEPTYSEEARKARYEGTVVLKIVVSSEGTVKQPSIVIPLGLGLDEKAIEAVSKWRFEPGTEDGKPVAVVANIEVNFHLL